MTIARYRTAPRRLLPAALAFGLALAIGAATAQDNRLPDIGSSAGNVLSPAKQAEYGDMVLAQLRHEGYVLEDPLLDGWLRDVGQRLAGASDRPQQSFTFFLLRDRQINAFATLGGYIGMNAGLILSAEREDEMAGVLAHEIAHVTQQHVLRGAEKAQRDSLPIMLAMLGAIVAAQQAGGNSSGDATSAAVMTGLGLLQQRQIDYTRDNEAEADRVGIRNLSRSGYDPEAMADFFQTLQSVVRMNQGDERARVPSYLQTHPVTLTRVSEARERAAKLEAPTVASTTTAGSNPLLPPGLSIATTTAGQRGQGATGDFGWARERLRVLSADTPAQAIREYQQMRSKEPLNDARRYGLAIAHQQAGQGREALQELTPLAAAHPGNLWLQVAVAEAEARAGQLAQADKRFELLLARMPTHRALALSYARVLAERNNRDAGSRAVAVLRPLSTTASGDPLFQQAYARANEIAGDDVRAGEAWAEAAFLGGRPEQALVQLNNLKKRATLDYYARSRIEARIAAITPTVLELRRQGIKDEEATGRLSVGVRAGGSAAER
ncbi:M48 family metalloprotease [Thermomonas carbonis]|uniref:Putative beta-barrel assembly-enhancing protease n=1 Tax=Thermomonas carbonis TaxID=1463158 RepID=A0A7G9SMM6_9GAMM|nr:M48 family metalloprotease [Thermomonas carbonis]QNN69101.1 M48 family metallopeptidase [Thermomonas carbonis]